MILADTAYVTGEELAGYFEQAIICSREKCEREAKWRLTATCGMCNWRRYAFHCTRHKLESTFWFRVLIRPSCMFLKDCEPFAHRDFRFGWTPL